MKLDTLTHGVELPSMSAHPIAEYWRPEVIEALRHQDWAKTDLRERIDLAAWQGFVADLPPRSLCQSSLEADVMARSE